ncbi:MAG: endonuclease/exonuclease/phosphatase family protein [Candidatus Limnocylindrales bacterium]
MRLGTLNIRNVMDRWAEREPLLLAEFAHLQPDLWGLQEVVYSTFEQDRLIAAAGSGRYEVRRGPAGRPDYGNAILVSEPLWAGLGPEVSGDRLELGFDRAASRVELSLPSGLGLRFVVTHLHHVVAALAERDEQVRQLLAWLAGLPPAGAIIVVGDFNAEPTEPAYERMVEAGFRSAYREANGTEPEITWPSGIIAPTMDTDGGPRCLDYIWLQGAARAGETRLCFDQHPPTDPTLYPSDHRGLLAEVELDA